jgi:hypothetical protein
MRMTKEMKKLEDIHDKMMYTIEKIMVGHMRSQAAQEFARVYTAIFRNYKKSNHDNSIFEIYYTLHVMLRNIVEVIPKELEEVIEKYHEIYDRIHGTTDKKYKVVLISGNDSRKG